MAGTPSRSMSGWQQWWPGADRDALAIENRRRRRAGGRRRATNDSTPAFSAAVPISRRPGIASSALGRVLEQLVLVARDRGRGRSRRGSRSPRRGRSAPAMSGVPASNLCGGVVVRRLLERDRSGSCRRRPDTAASTRAAPLAVEHADAGRAEHLVAGERVEVAVRAPARRPACARPPARRRPARGRRARCARRTISSTGLTVPSAFETCDDRDELRPLGQQRRERVEIAARRASVDRDDAEPRALSVRRGSATARCSSGAPAPMMTISSPAADARAPVGRATRLMASVVPRTKTISLGVARVQEPAARSRARSS